MKNEYYATQRSDYATVTGAKYSAGVKRANMSVHLLGGILIEASGDIWHMATSSRGKTTAIRFFSSREEAAHFAARWVLSGKELAG